MNKKFAIGIAAVVMVTVVVIMGSTYYSTLMQMQEYKPRMSTVSVDLTNGSPVLGFTGCTYYNYRIWRLSM